MAFSSNVRVRPATICGSAICLNSELFKGLVVIGARNPKNTKSAGNTQGVMVSQTDVPVALMDCSIRAIIGSLLLRSEARNPFLSLSRFTEAFFTGQLWSCWLSRMEAE